MRQKLDIADVEERTKIRAKYLRALENEEWGLLPGPTFVKTFLRTYAEVVGVDPHLLVEEYRSRHETEEPQDLQPIAPASRRPPRRRQAPAGGPPGRLAVALGLLGAVVVFLLVLGLAGGGDDGGGGQTEAARTEAAKPRPARTERAKKPPPAPKGVTLRITPEGPTYACLDSGDGTERLFEGTLDAPRTFRNPKELRLNLGRRSAVVRANGEAVAIEPSPEPLGLRITRRGAEEITEGTRPCA